MPICHRSDGASSLEDLGHVQRLREVESLLAKALPLEVWELEPDGAQVQLLRDEQWWWVCCQMVGAIRFAPHHSEISLFCADGCSPSLFRFVIFHHWLPLVYTAWGHQVLHASAACQLASQKVIALMGESGAGKSTWAYALGQRDGWTQLADDALAISTCEEHPQLVPMPGFVRLRKPSVAFLGPAAVETISSWPCPPPHLACLYLLDPQEAPTALTCTPMAGADAYTSLLSHCFALDLSQPDLRRSLMQGYLRLSSQIRIFRIQYHKDFAKLDQALDMLVQNALSLL